MPTDGLFLHLLLTYQLPIIFLGAFFLGETIIISAAFLAGQGLWSLYTVFWLALLGTIISDSLWYFLGKYVQKTNRWEKYQQKYSNLILKLDRFFGKKPFFSLLFIKFLYGTRIITIMYLSVRAIKFVWFLLFDFLGTILWLVVIIAIGWLAGHGINILPAFNTLKYSLSILVVLIISARIISLWISRKILKK